MKTLESIKRIKAAMKEKNYVCDDELAFSLYLAQQMEKPLLLEGEPGVGKTEVAKVVADVLERNLIRLQCYEGLDATSFSLSTNCSATCEVRKRLCSAPGSCGLQTC